MSRLIRLYPRAWRDRYGDEVAHLIHERPPTLADRIDLVRGALDAQLHPHVLVGEPEPGPWTHRIPGLLALAAGAALAAGTLGIAFGTSSGGGAADSLVGGAVMLMLISLPGDYLGSFGRRIGIGLVFVFVSVFAAPATGWWPPVVAVAIIAELVAVSGLLTMAAIRAGIGRTGRWVLIAMSVGLPIAAVVAHAALHLVTGQTVVADGAPIAALVLLPYGLAWLLVGLRMAVRGSPTIIDPPTAPTPAREVARA